MPGLIPGGELTKARYGLHSAAVEEHSAENAQGGKHRENRCKRSLIF